MRKANLFALMLGCLLAVCVSWGQGLGESKTIIDNWNTGVTAPARLAGALAYPGQGETQPSQPATPELTAGPTTNVARGKPAQQSSTYSGGYPAANGVDGRKDNGSMFHTGIENNPWWQVDLQGNYALSYIMLYNRTDCCSERERTVQVLLSQNGSNWQTIYAHPGSDFKELRVEAGGRRARYVRVQLAEQNYFHLQEVEVYGARSGSADNISPEGTPGRSESKTIIDNWNTGGCGFTNSAVMNLSRPTHVESVQLWYNWAAGETSLPYELSRGGSVLRDGQFRRGSCDPYQTAWCAAVDAIDIRLAAGSYTFTTAKRRVCQNGGSNGLGFIRVTARARLAGPEAYPGGEETQPSQPATPEVTAGPTTNLARGKPAQQSSTYSGDYPAANGVDGRKDNGSMFHTGIESNPWWQVDLQGNYALSYIVLYNRTDCCSERERTVQVLLSQNGSDWQTIYAHNGTDFKELRVEAGGRQARYVRVQLAEQNYFHLQEVEVYGAR